MTFGYGLNSLSYSCPRPSSDIERDIRQSEACLVQDKALVEDYKRQLDEEKNKEKPNQQRVESLELRLWNAERTQQAQEEVLATSRAELKEAKEREDHWVIVP